MINHTENYGLFVDLIKLYRSQHMDPDAEPKQLLNKFQSDVRYNF